MALNVFFFIKTENVALVKNASQSGSHYSYSTADKAVDGDNNPDMAAESCVYPGIVGNRDNFLFIVNNQVFPKLILKKLQNL